MSGPVSSQFGLDLRPETLEIEGGDPTIGFRAPGQIFILAGGSFPIGSNSFPEAGGVYV